MTFILIFFLVCFPSASVLNALSASDKVTLKLRVDQSKQLTQLTLCNICTCESDQNDPIKLFHLFSYGIATWLLQLAIIHYIAT